MSHKDNAAIAIMIKQEQRIRELVQQCEKLREERNTVRVKVEQPLLLRIRELEQLANEAIEVIEDMAGGPCYPSIEFRKRLEPPR